MTDEIAKQQGESIGKDITKAILDAYKQGVIEGRSKERSIILNSDYVKIDVAKLNKDCESPCKGCQYYTSKLLIGCELSPQVCEDKQRQLEALKIKVIYDSQHKDKKIMNDEQHENIRKFMKKIIHDAKVESTKAVTTAKTKILNSLLS